MAVQSGKKASKHDAHDMKGASTVDPTRASKPAEPTYKFPLDRGLPKIADKGAPLTGYGRGQYAGPSSVGVNDSADMTDTPNLATLKGDDVLQSLITNGHGDQSGENNAVADLQRKVSTDGYAPSHGMRSRSGEGGKIPGA